MTFTCESCDVSFTRMWSLKRHRDGRCKVMNIETSIPVNQFDIEKLEFPEKRHFCICKPSKRVLAWVEYNPGVKVRRPNHEDDPDGFIYWMGKYGHLPEVLKQLGKS